jgi:AraC-like DNA-binding protein
MEKECWGLQFTQEWLNSFKESASLQRLFRAMSYGINLGQFNNAEHQAFTTIVGKDPLRSIGAFFNLMAMIADRADFLTVSTNNAYSNVMSQKLSQRMERVSKHIQDHYQNTITLSEISDIASMTEQSFSRWFRQTSGLTFVDYLMQLRTTVASNLLINTNKAMTEGSCRERFQLQFLFQPRFPQNKRLLSTRI